jgi:hypothetical protein
MKKIINVNLAILLAFVLASAIFTVSGSVYAQGNEDEDEGNNENGGDNENGAGNENGADANVNPLTGTNAPAEEVAANVTAFTNGTTQEDVTAQLSNITESGPPAELDYSSGQNVSSANSTSQAANSTSQAANSTNTTTAQ